MTPRDSSRREFLQSSAAAAIALAAFPRAARAKALSKPAEFRLGIASYSLRHFALDKSIEMIKSLRVSPVNFKSVHVPYEKSAAELAAIRAQIESAGLSIVGGGTVEFPKDSDEDVQKYFDYARAAGMPLIVCAPIPAVLPRLEKFAKLYDIKIAIHNHGPEDGNFPSPYDVLAAVKNLDARMGLCMDIGHASRAGADIVQAVHDAGPRLLDMHAKDLRDPKVRESQCVVGEGVLPIVELFRALDATGYKGCVNLEYEIDERDPLPGMTLSMLYMRGALAGLGLATG